MKTFLKRLIIRSRLLKPLKQFKNNQLIIFNYHRLLDETRPILFDDGVYGPDAKRFRTEMEWIKKETKVISEAELIDIIYNNKPINQTCSMVTFDDGYRDNYDIAFPILKELGIPAVFFIPTKHICDRKLGWWDIMAYLIKNTKLTQINFRNQVHDLSDKREVIDHFILELKAMEANKVDQFLAELSIATEVSIPSLAIQGEELMTWEQIKKLSQNGMTIGSHSHDHSILSKQGLPELRIQLQKSIDILEEKIQKKIESIAYPVGGYDHFNSDTQLISKELGFKIGYSYLTGVNNWNDIEAFNVKRVSIQGHWQNLDYQLAFPNKAFVFKDNHNDQR